MKRHVAPLMIIFALAITLAAGYILGRRAEAPQERIHNAGEAQAAQQVYTCSMHPQVRLDRPGNCPICEMPLILANSLQPSGGDVPVLSLSDRAVAMINLETTPVEPRVFDRGLRAVGKIQYNESSLAAVTARVDGYAEKLFVNFTGVAIKAGDHLVEVYSPDLLLAQQELLITLQGAQDAPLIETAKLKLQRWGLTRPQINTLINSRKITDRATLFSPINGTVIEKNIVENSSFKAGDALYKIANLDTVWAYLDIYEYDLAWVSYGQQVELVTEAYPGRVFTGTVTFVEPVLDDRTRTVRVPVHVENQDHALKPGMYVSAVIKARLGPDGQATAPDLSGKFTCPMHPQVIRDGPGTCPVCDLDLKVISVPAQAAALPDHHHTAAEASLRYACPMKCEGDKTYEQPGNCPICNMVLKPVAGPAAPGQPGLSVSMNESVRYACPMKCEGDKTYEQPGNCPVCNMFLKPVAGPAAPGRQASPGLLAVPASAILDSGTRRIVYVESGRGRFESREVTLGPRCGDFFPVLKGLARGERVVSRGGFLIDSQFQITGHPSLYYPGGLNPDQVARSEGTGAATASRLASEPSVTSISLDTSTVGHQH